MKKIILILQIIIIAMSLIACQDVFKIAIIDSDAGEPYATARINMLKTLTDNGYVEGKNLKVIHVTINNDEEKGRKVITKLKKKKPNLFFVNGTIAARAARDVLLNDADHKVVFSCVTGPIGEGLMENLDVNPTTNFTGVSFSIPIHMRFNIIKKRYPHDRTKNLKIGLIYADMPQSHSYKRWIEEAMAGSIKTGNAKSKTYAKLSGFEFHFRMVPFVSGAYGNQQMADSAKQYVLELNNTVDVFVSPNDQMGANRPFAEMVWQNATKPLIGLGRLDVVDGWGAMGSIFPAVEEIGKQSGAMIVKVFKGDDISTIPAEIPGRSGYALDLNKITKFGITVPQEVLDLIRPEDLVQ